MFAALSENSDFFRERVNLFCMLAPCARVDRCQGSTIRSMADNSTVMKMMRKMGPEMLPEP